jgi:5'-nucleotidase
MTSANKPRRGVAKPIILLTNDDGISAEGLRHLCEALATVGRVVVVAPDQERSGVGHAFTFNKPLHYERVRFAPAWTAYVVSGTPVDCVKFAVSFLLPARPEVVVSGLNIGENSGLSAFYSGTVAATREGAFWNIASIAFSVCEEAGGFAKEYAAMAPALMKRILELAARAKNNGVYYNVNFPPCAPEAVRGLKVTEQSMAFFDDRYETIDVGTHHTKKGYVIYGEKKDIEKSNKYDSRALMNGYITVTPLGFDSTARKGMARIKAMEDRTTGPRLRAGTEE